MAPMSPRRTRSILVVGSGLLGLGAAAWAVSVLRRPPGIELTENGIAFDGETRISIPRDDAGALDLDVFDPDHAGRILADHLQDDRHASTGDTSLSRPRRHLVTAIGQAPLILLESVFEAMRQTGDSVFLATGSGGRVLLDDGSRSDSGAFRCLLLEDESTSYFTGPAACDSLVFAYPTSAPDGPERLRAVLAAGPSDSFRRLDVVSDMRPEASFEGLLAALRAIGTEPTPTRISYHRATGFKRFANHLRRIRRKAQGEEWLTPEELRRFVPAFVEPLGARAADSGIGLVGLERVLFHPVAARDMAVLAPEALALLPLSSTLPVKVERPEHASDSWDPDDLTWQDFPLPRVLDGHTFVLRQVVHRPYTVRDFPIWWALYDNGRRTGIWTWSGGLGHGRVLPNYRLRHVVGGQGGRFALRLRAETHRSSFHTEKGVELGFRATPTGLALETARTAWGFFLGDRTIVVTESVHGGSMLERSIETGTGADHLLRACGFTDPRRDEHWTWNWHRLERTAACLVRGEGATTRIRPLSTPSYLEAGWKPEGADTTSP